LVAKTQFPNFFGNFFFFFCIIPLTKPQKRIEEYLCIYVYNAHCHYVCVSISNILNMYIHEIHTYILYIIYIHVQIHIYIHTHILYVMEYIHFRVFCFLFFSIL
jgi:hypothetical protein